MPVYVKMIRRSHPVDQAMICIPTTEDLKRITDYIKCHKIGQDIIHTEPIHLSIFKGPLKDVSQEEYINKLKEIKPSRKLGGKNLF